jgi:hypothetical protein
MEMVERMEDRPMAHRLLGIGLVLVLAGAFSPSAARAADASAGTAGKSGTVELGYRAYRKWDLELPAERFAPVGRGFAFSAVLGHDFVVEPEGTSLKIDTDGDGAFDVTAEGPEAQITLLGTGDRRYAVRLVDQKGWHYAPGGAARGKILGDTIQLFDQNLDGDYCDVGEDAFIIGRGKIAAFLSEVVAIDGALYELEITPDGSRIDYRPYVGPTGTLKLGPCDTKAKVLSAVVRSSDGRFCFDMAQVQTGLLVPAGSYQLVQGTIGLGESRVAMTAGRSKPFEVRAGGMQELSWGGPVQAEFAYRHSGGQVDLSPDAVWYYGAAGEEYKAWAPIGKSPEFTIRNRKTGREIAQAYFPGTC